MNTYPLVSSFFAKLYVASTTALTPSAFIEYMLVSLNTDAAGLEYRLQECLEEGQTIEGLAQRILLEITFMKS